MAGGDTSWQVLVGLSQATNRKVVVATELTGALPGERPVTDELRQALQTVIDAHGTPRPENAKQAAGLDGPSG